MTRPTGVREIIEGIDINELSLEFGWRGGPVFGEKKNFASVVKAVVDKAAYHKVVAIALMLERRRNDYAELAMRSHHEEEIVRDNERLKAIAKGET